MFLYGFLYRNGFLLNRIINSCLLTKQNAIIFLKILSLEYHRYLKEVVSIPESDKAFKSTIENANTEDIKSGRISQHLHLEFV